MTPNSENLNELLAWHSDAGIDCALMDAPVDRFAQAAIEAEKRKVNAATPPLTHDRREPKGRQSTPPTPVSRSPAAGMAVPDSNAVAKAQELAKSATTLEDLRKAVERFEGCNLKFTARSTVFSDGKPGSKLMLVGEAPGRDEDEQGLPFVGRSGQLLDKMLAAIGLDRTSVYISNVIPWRPPGNRTPSPAETDICRPFIERHIELANPEMLMLVGGSSCQTLLKTKNGIMSMRGKWQSVEVGAVTLPALPTLHPAYLLRNPVHKRLAWNDLQAVKSKLEI